MTLLKRHTKKNAHLLMLAFMTFTFVGMLTAYEKVEYLYEKEMKEDVRPR